MGVVLGGVVRIPLKLSFVMPSTYHFLLLLDTHWLLGPKPCQSCCSAVRHGSDHQFHTVPGGFKPTCFFRKCLVKGWFSRFFWLGDLYRKVEIHHTVRMMKTVEFMQIPLKLESTTDDVGIFMDICFFLSQVIFDYLSQFYFGLHSCKQVCSRRRGNPSSTKALPSTLSDATGISSGKKG